MAKSNFIKDFTAFISRGNAIDMAVGIIVGSVMTSVVNSLVKDVIMPPIGVLVGGIDFSNWKIALGFGTDATINIGVFLNTIISFFTTDKKPADNSYCCQDQGKETGDNTRVSILSIDNQQRGNKMPILLQCG